VFRMPRGAPINSDVLGSKYFKPVLERAQLPSTIRLYDLRHTMATLLLLAGEHPKILSERLGHTSIQMTLDIYSHVLPTMQQAATSKLEGLLWKTGKQLANRSGNEKGSADATSLLTPVNASVSSHWEAGIRTPIGGSRVLKNSRFFFHLVRLC